jgi:hypothetical protein
MNGIKFLENKMNLEQAIEIVINEAEVSALGDKSDEQMKILGAVEVVQAFYEEHGHHFSNFSVDNDE